MFKKFAKNVLTQSVVGVSYASFSTNVRLFDEEVEEVIEGTPYTELTVGFVKELAGETRCPQSPASVEDLVAKGFSVIMEKGAGDLASFPDYLFEKAGAQIKPKAAEVLGAADIVIKLNPPTVEEIDKMKDGSTLISFLYPARNEELLKKLNAKKMVSFAMDCVPRISRAQVFDALSSISNIEGYKAVVEAANHFPGFFAGQMTAAGRVDPAKILVIGAGVAGLAALQTGKNMGAICRAFDTRAETREQVESFGGTFLSVDIEEDGDGGGGYAKEMSPEFIAAEMELFAKQCREVDIVITTALIPGKPAPKLILKEHVDAMKPGSVIVDLASRTGGNVETTKPGEIYKYNGVTHIGTLELSRDLPSTSSNLYANNVRKLLYSFGEKKHYNIDLEDEVVRGAICTLEGETMWPAPIVEKPVVEAPVVEQVVVEKKEMTPFQKTLMRAVLVTGVLGSVQSVGMTTDHNLMNMFSIFSLGCIVGYKIVTDVLPALHSPLISVTNAVSGIIVCGGLLLMPQAAENKYASLLGAAAIFISSINVFGGFLITQKMLNMFKKPDDPPTNGHLNFIPLLTASAAYMIMQQQGYSLAGEGTNLAACLACVLALGGLCKHETALFGNAMGIMGVGLGILSTLGGMEFDKGLFTLMAGLAAVGGSIGLFGASKVPLMDLPQLVALFHSFVGLAATAIGFGTYLVHPHADLLHNLSVSLGIYIGGVTFTGSVVAFLKLNGMMSGAVKALPAKNLSNAIMNGGALALSGYFCTGMESVAQGVTVLGAITGLSFAAGAHLAMAIGGADMPVVITVLNSYSGWALCAEGFLLNNKLLTIVGSFVGASGAILSGIMCKAMNRTIFNVLFQGVKAGSGKQIEGTIETSNVEQVAEWVANGQDIVIVPGFGLAAARGQYAIADMANKLIEAGKKVRFCIHPVAGRMPGQMNVLLAEAGIGHDIVFEMEEMEEDFPDVDVVLCIGSNDIFNKGALDDETSPIYGMPVIPVWEAAQTVVFKRTLNPGYSAIDNPVFYDDKSVLLLGDAKESCEQLNMSIAARL